MRLLHLIASPRGENSRTLQIAEAFLVNLKKQHVDLVADELDLTQIKLPEMSAGTVDAKYTLISGGKLTPEVQTDWDMVTQFSTDFLKYDCYLISSPMWNFTVPYFLKHYIDVVMQAGILFRFTQQGVEGLALDKKMFCITSRGSDYSVGKYLHQFDFQEPYLRAIFGMAGITDITFLNAQPMDFTPEITVSTLIKAKADTQPLALDSAA